ncbi:hypothetical protein Pla52o_26590 [Novipirellula galeiformis]|uniref:Uncharacterized protein n=1 Tax=Novipirellula galeiformis TaxID=2528004 RepID=A0A5C6CHX0_9BACT|nr:hypothetical protein Pla52o_26590 [Novipirellula galeiformis]
MSLAFERRGPPQNRGTLNTSFKQSSNDRGFHFRCQFSNYRRLSFSSARAAFNAAASRGSLNSGPAGKYWTSSCK